MRVGLIVVFLWTMVTGLNAQQLREKYRPQFHFTPEKNWINDPNGLVYYAGEYHMYYQYNPYANKWGHMSWGHAVSTDLVHWKELPVAIPEAPPLTIFSGSAVVDPFNTSGFVQMRGQVPMVAIYTGDIPDTHQSQHIAYSLDSGRTFTKFNGNPVLDLDKKDFRDPKVFWHEPSKKWIMAVMLPTEKKVQFYSSKSLKAWTLLSEFGPAGDTSGIWECPDIFRVPVTGSPGKYKWVFMMSPAPYMQYFVGEFDGTRFNNETPSGNIYRPDYGPDYYAGIVYNNLPIGSAPISIAWVNNWKYAGEIPTGVWRGAMSLPRELTLKKVGDEWILLQNPVDQLKLLQAKPVPVAAGQELKMQDASYLLEWSWPSSGAAQELSIGDREFVVRYDPASREVSIDRGGSRGFDHPEYRKMSIYKAVVPGTPANLRLRLYMDESIAELYVGDGEVALTSQVFAGQPLVRGSFSNPTPASYIDISPYR